MKTRLGDSSKKIVNLDSEFRVEFKFNLIYNEQNLQVSKEFRVELGLIEDYLPVLISSSFKTEKNLIFFE